MTKRAPISTDVQTQLLVQSKRRCCLCAFLNQDWDQKRIQIAHISHDPTDSSQGNLVVLCLSHHDEYDSRTSQSKGYTPSEIRHYKNALIKALACWDRGPHQVVIPHPLVADLRPTQTSTINLSASPAIPVTQPPGLDLMSLYAMTLDPTLREKAIEVVCRTISLSPELSKIASVKGTQGYSPHTNESYITLLVGDDYGWTFEVLLFTCRETVWRLVAQVPLTSQKAHEPIVRYISGHRAGALVIEHLAGYGTGVYRKAITWYRVRPDEVVPLLSYPVYAYVVGWGQAFQRHISGKEITCPAFLTEGARLHIALRVDYKSDPSREQYQEVDLFSISKNLVLSWDEEGGLFLPTDEYSLSFDEAEGLFAEGSSGFLARNVDHLISLARHGNGLQRSWVREFLGECEQTEAAAAVKSALESTGKL